MITSTGAGRSGTRLTTTMPSLPPKTEVREILSKAKEFADVVEQWIGKNHPSLKASQARSALGRKRLRPISGLEPGINLVEDGQDVRQSINYVVRTRVQ